MSVGADWLSGHVLITRSCSLCSNSIDRIFTLINFPKKWNNESLGRWYSPAPIPETSPHYLAVTTNFQIPSQTSHRWCQPDCPESIDVRNNKATNRQNPTISRSETFHIPKTLKRRSPIRSRRCDRYSPDSQALRTAQTVRICNTRSHELTHLGFKAMLDPPATIQERKNAMVRRGWRCRCRHPSQSGAGEAPSQQNATIVPAVLQPAERSQVDLAEMQLDALILVQMVFSHCEGGFLESTLDKSGRIYVQAVHDSRQSGTRGGVILSG